MRPLKLLAFIVLALGLSKGRAANVLSYHNDAQSTGQNLAETQITPANVTVANFAKRYSTAMDGQVYAQPLYKAAVAVVGGANPGTHDLVFVATQHDSLYALDASSGAIVWQTSFLAAGLAGATSITTMPQGDTGSGDITVEVGICGTPVIDPATNFLYLVAKTKQIVGGVTASPHYVQTLYKIDITNGNATANANIAASLVIADTVNVNGANNYTHRTNATATAVQDPFCVGVGYSGEAVSLGGQSRVYFNAQRQMNRPGLVLTGGRIYIAFASHGDNGPYHGWLLSYDKTTLALTGALNTTPNGGLGGIWQGGGIPAVDAAGSFYFETGNGSFTSSTATGTFPVNGNYGDCFVKVSLDATTTPASQNINGWGLKVADYFSPFNNAALDSVDRDLGSGGCLVLPDSAGNATFPHLLIGAGKEGKIYLINRDNMGKYDSATDHVIQTQAYSGSVPHMGLNGGSFGTPAFFNGTLYYGGSGDVGKTWAVANAAFSTSVVKETPDGFAFPGSTPSISASGATNGVVWMLDRGSNQLRAYAAADISSELWTSAQAAGGRDTLGAVVKFAVPTVADGHVFVGTGNALVGYGPPQPPTAGPAAPTALTAAPVSGIQIDLAWTDNANNEDGYKIEQSPNGTTFTEIATVGVNATAYSVTGLQVSTPYYFRVRAFNSFNTLSYSAYTGVASAVTSGTTPTLDFSSGFASAGPLLNFQWQAGINGTRLRLTDGGGGEGTTAWTKNTQSIAKFTTQFTFQITAGSGFADGFTFCMQNAGNTVVGAPGGGMGYAGIGTSVALKFDTYPGVSTTGLYVNGAAPDDATPASIDMLAAGIDLHSGHVFSVALTYDGTTLTERVSDNTTGAVFTQAYTVNIPGTVGAATAFLGFTGGTGGETTTQDILTWSYSIPPSSPPAAPSALTATPASGTQINLAWTDNATNEAGFKIERKAGVAGTYAQIGVTGANIAVFNDSALTGGIDYYYQVRATNAAGDSAYAPEAHALTPVPPLTPTGASTTLVTSTQINLAWTDNATNETGYKVLRKTGLAGTFFEIASLPANSTSYNNTGLSPGVSYDYHIQAYNLAGYSDFAGTTVQTLTKISIAATDATAQEATSNTATLTVSRVGETTGALAVTYAIATGAGQAGQGTRYTLSPASPVTIPDGSSSAAITITPLSDAAVLGTQSITLNLSANPAYEFGATTSAAASLLDAPINVWKIAEFGSLAAAQSAAAADNAAPAGDGLANLEKYALGLHPLTAYPPNAAGLPAIVLDPALGNRLTLTFRRPRPAPAGVSYFIESTGNLVTGPWITLSLESGYPLDNGNGTETLKADDTQTTGGAARRFLHLRITRP